MEASLNPVMSFLRSVLILYFILHLDNALELYSGYTCVEFQAIPYAYSIVRVVFHSFQSNVTSAVETALLNSLRMNYKLYSGNNIVK
jgi:hypothetical protein